MVLKVKINENTLKNMYRFRIRLDFRAEGKTGHFFFGSKSCVEVAKDVRDEQVSLYQNASYSGLSFQDFDTSLDIYLVKEDIRRKKQEAAYAPLLMTVTADHLEDISTLLWKPELKKIDILGPDNIHLEKSEIESLINRISKDFQQEVNERGH